MAKALAYRRSTQEVVTIDTVNNRVDALGSAVATAQTSNAFPGRSKNLVAVFRGETYFLYLDNAGAVRLATLASGAWSNVAGYGPVTAGSGTIVPVALQVDRGSLVAIVHRSSSVAIDGEIIYKSQDGVTWTGPYTANAPTQPTVSTGGHSTVWRNTVFFATTGGIGYYLPNTNALSLYDTGSDSGLASASTQLGHFAHWNGSLYFMQAGSIPTIYKLTDAWDPAAPASAPAWTKVATTGIPSVGVVGIGPDTGTMLMFVSRTGNLCLAYGGQLGSKLVQATPAAFPAFTDVTTELLPATLANTSDLGFSIFVDDRRGTNELQSLVLRSPGASSVILAGWDGASQVAVRTMFASTLLMASDERFGELRTYTALQPACFITNVTQPFPGRVVVSYTVRDASSRPIDVFGDYSVSGDRWSPMTQGDGDDGATQLATSPSGVPHTFFWDTFVDAEGDYPFMSLRIVARISGV